MLQLSANIGEVEGKGGNWPKAERQAGIDSSKPSNIGSFGR